MQKTNKSTEFLPSSCLLTVRFRSELDMHESKHVLPGQFVHSDNFQGHNLYIKQLRLTRLYILTITIYNIGQYRINNSWIAISQFALYKSAVDGIIHQKYT